MAGNLPPLRVFEITETRTVVVKAEDPLAAQMIAADAFAGHTVVTKGREVVVEGPRFVDGRIRERPMEGGYRSPAARAFDDPPLPGRK